VLSAGTLIAAPPASFNLDDVKRKINEMMKSHEGQ